MSKNANSEWFKFQMAEQHAGPMFGTINVRFRGLLNHRQLTTSGAFGTDSFLNAENARGYPGVMEKRG